MSSQICLKMHQSIVYICFVVLYKSAQRKIKCLEKSLLIKCLLRGKHFLSKQWSVPVLWTAEIAFLMYSWVSLFVSQCLCPEGLLSSSSLSDLLPLTCSSTRPPCGLSVCLSSSTEHSNTHAHAHTHAHTCSICHTHSACPIQNT